MLCKEKCLGLQVLQKRRIFLIAICCILGKGNIFFLKKSERSTLSVGVCVAFEGYSPVIQLL